ncbi:hypothetical protein V8O11_15725 [Erwinia aphidicola]|uniref:hypothetical protein n=1 Tax=Erwinia aphidicola TaxID=68334 RepID=UPI00300C1F3B
MDESIISEFEELYKEFIDDDGSLAYQLVDGEFHCFNDLVIIPVKAIEKSIKIVSADDIEIFSHQGDLIGFLCPLAYQENEHVVARLNERRLFAFFVDSFLYSQQTDKYTFINHYVAIELSSLSYYKTVMSTSEYWGGYTHKSLNSTNQRVISEIKVHESIKVPSINHEESIVLAVHSSSSFERFLKYYHQIELLFDSLFISRLKNIRSSDLKDYAIIMKEFGNGKKNELDIIKYILKKYLVNYNEIIRMMNLVQNHLNIANDMFCKLGKESNPLKTNDEWEVLIYLLSNNSLSVLTCSTNQQVSGFTAKLISKNNLDIFNDFIVNLCSYWIYRIRCCIAHNKIGEYIFSYNDEGFISEFGEHLLLEVIKDIFSNPALHADMNL